MLATPAAPAVRETLEKILLSDTFKRSDRARSLLSYLVEQEQAGKAAKLKGFSIAVDVFGKDSEFDSSTDAVVRVQAGRLRELLDQYYATEGREEPVRILIPRGSYIPTYDWRAGPEAGEPRPEASAPSVGRSRFGRRPSLVRQLRFFRMSTIVVILLFGLLVFRDGLPWGEGLPLSTSSVTSKGMPDALPQLMVTTSSDEPPVKQVASLLRTALSGFDTTTVVTRDQASDGNTALNAMRFLLEVQPGPESGRVVVDLQDMSSGVVLTSRVLAAEDLAPEHLNDRIAGLATEVAPVSGVIYHHLEKTGIQSGLVSCLLKSERFYAEQDAEKLEVAYRCMEGLMAVGVKSPLVYAELASLQLQAVAANYPYPSGANHDAALALARQAIQIGAASPYAHRAFGYFQTRSGHADESLRWMKKAYELSPYDLSMAASYGYALIFTGNYADGTPIMAKAIDAASAHPTWWDFGLFLGQFMQGRNAEAYAASTALAATDVSHYLAARLIAAKADGDDKATKALIKQIRDLYPKFTANPKAVFRARNYPDDMAVKLSEALEAAGLRPEK